jgi:hypothetical protein
MDKDKKHEQIKSFLKGNGLFFLEFPNYQLQIDGVNLWTSSEKWYDPKTSTKGVGVNKFVEFVTK